ncbi:hypothetical protein C943_01125 [Mariniradius saccharolyticus AK6]|uniref:Uncharacterized protein n=1 Tax=Mariniradius saccharolyticus AK6 TaxID=1239962 RepID=M7XCW1_9BACT|nr:hypothetical protein C943_01125 [Mariniradius saccharolyticus AK6]
MVKGLATKIIRKTVTIQILFAGQLFLTCKKHMSSINCPLVSLGRGSF